MSCFGYNQILILKYKQKKARFRGRFIFLLSTLLRQIIQI